MHIPLIATGMVPLREMQFSRVPFGYTNVCKCMRVFLSYQYIDHKGFKVFNIVCVCVCLYFVCVYVCVYVCV